MHLVSSLGVHFSSYSGTQTLWSTYLDWSRSKICDDDQQLDNLVTYSHTHTGGQPPSWQISRLQWIPPLPKLQCLNLRLTQNSRLNLDLTRKVIIVYSDYTNLYKVSGTYIRCVWKSYWQCWSRWQTGECIDDASDDENTDLGSEYESEEGGHNNHLTTTATITTWCSLSAPLIREQRRWVIHSSVI